MPNTKTERNDFFKNLSDLFKSTFIITNKRGEKKVISLDKLNNNANLERNFSYTPASTLNRNNGWFLNDSNQIEITRHKLYNNYEKMDKDSIIAAALNIYANETVTRNEKNELIEIKSDNQKIKDSLYNLFYNILNLEFVLWSWVRNMVKYGDFFLKLDIIEKMGVVDAHPLSVYAIERIDNYNNSGETIFLYDLNVGGYVPIKGDINNRFDKKIVFNDFEIAHFRLIDDTNFLPYGKSILEQIRRDWNRLYMLEDSALIHRVTRAPEKRIFKIDVGNLSPQEVDTYIEKVMQQIKKESLIDPETGEYNLYYGAKAMLEDLVIPVRGGQSGTEVDVLPGLNYEAMDDILYFLKKIAAGLNIPLSFLSFEESVGESANLTTQDIRFAKTIERIQRIVESELTKIAVIHLYSQGFDEAQLNNFQIILPRSSQIAELQRLEIFDQRMNILSSAKDLGLIPLDIILKSILNLSEKEVKEYKDKVLEDKYFLYRANAIENEGKDPEYTTEEVEGEGEMGEGGGGNFNFEQLEKEYDNKINNITKYLSKSAKNKFGRNKSLLS